MSQSKPAADSSSFEMNVQEDVAAELEAFILRSRLGLWDEANEILDKALWRHLNFFPVFAEIAVYLVEREDNERFSRLKTKVGEENLVFAKISEEHLVFAKTEEEDFVKTFVARYQSTVFGAPLAIPHLLRPGGSESLSPVQVCLSIHVLS